MNADTQSLLNQALSLPAEEREVLAVQLLGSVEPAKQESADLHEKWLAELDRRVTASDSGESASIPIEEAWPRLAGEPWPSDDEDV